MKQHSTCPDMLINSTCGFGGRRIPTNFRNMKETVQNWMCAVGLIHNRVTWPILFCWADCHHPHHTSWHQIKDGMGRAGSTHGKVTITHKILVRKPEGKWPLGRPRHRKEDNIKMDLRDTGCELSSSSSGKVLVVSYCEHCNKPMGPIKGGEFLYYLSDY
jgi:hypothetical protein